MSKTVHHGPWSIRTSGMCCVFFEKDGEKELILVNGSIRGYLLPTLDGKPYLYDNYPWEENGLDKISREECLKMAEKAAESNLICNDKLSKEIEALTI